MSNSFKFSYIIQSKHEETDPIQHIAPAVSLFWWNIKSKLFNTFNVLGKTSFPQWDEKSVYLLSEIKNRHVKKLTWKNDSASGLFFSATYKRCVSECDQTRQPNCSEDWKHNVMKTGRCAMVESFPKDKGLTISIDFPMLFQGCQIDALHLDVFGPDL